MPVKEIKNVGGKPVVHELPQVWPLGGVGIEDSWYRLIEGGKEKLVSFKPTGRVLGKDLYAIDTVKKTGIPVFYTEDKTGKLIELTEVRVLSGEERMAFGALYHKRRALRANMVGKPVDQVRDDTANKVIADTISAGDLETFRDRVNAMDTYDLAVLSNSIAFFHEFGALDLIPPGSRELIRHRLPKWDAIALERLGERLKTKHIKSREIRGLIVRHGLDWIAISPVKMDNGPGIQKTDLDTEFLGKSREEVQASISPASIMMARDFNFRTEVAGDDLTLAYESTISRQSADSIARFYAAKWNGLNDAWRKTGAPIDVLQAFSSISEELVVHPWNPAIERGYDYIIDGKWWLEGESPKTISKTAATLNDGLKVGLPANELAKAVRGDLLKVAPALARDMDMNQAITSRYHAELQRLEQEDGPPEDIERARTEIRRIDEIDINMHRIRTALQPLIQHPIALVRLAESWRKVE
jgi:hypothetical protein